MATKLTKRVVRESATLGRRGRVIMVALCPGDVFEFWDKGTRKKYLLTIGAARDTAIKVEANSIRRAKEEAKKLKKEDQQRQRELNAAIRKATRKRDSAMENA